jgi:hypothetical protein
MGSLEGHRSWHRGTAKGNGTKAAAIAVGNEIVREEGVGWLVREEGVGWCANANQSNTKQIQTKTFDKVFFIKR